MDEKFISMFREVLENDEKTLMDKLKDFKKNGFSSFSFDCHD